LSFSVRWGNVISSSCNIHSGLLQGNLLSPKFYDVYMDKLLFLLEKSGIGCKIFKQYCGIIMYADDILLLSSSVQCLQRMLDLCAKFCFDLGVTFGSSKSYCLAMYPDKLKFPVSSILLNGVELQWVNKLHYLGISICNDSKHIFDVSKQISDFYGAIHSIITNCGPNRELVTLEILKRKCAPILFYGLDCINVDYVIKDSISKAWNRAIRLVFGINKRESTRLLFYYCNLLSASFYIGLLQIGFFISVKIIK
jgi:hypothetical protein